MDRIYLDHAATTPLHPEAREAMLPWLGGVEGRGSRVANPQSSVPLPTHPHTDPSIHHVGNPSSLHAEGRLARQAIDQARETLSGAMGCLFAEVLFVGSGTEAANLAIVGAALGNSDPARNTVLLGAAEHHCVRETRGILERLGYRALTIPVDRMARLDPNALESMIGPDTLLVAAMHANNELGTIQDLALIAELAHRHGALLFTDAVQSFLTPGFAETGQADLVAVAAHKINGPKGVGGLRIKAGTPMKPVIAGGGQEREMRAGTENVAAIAGFATAVRALQDDPRGLDRQRAARDSFVAFLSGSGVEGLAWSTPFDSAVLGGHAHLRFAGASAESMLIVLDQLGVSASSGAACSSGSLEPSHVLLACGYSVQEAKEGLRFTFGRDSTVSEAEEAARRVIRAVQQVRR